MSIDSLKKQIETNKEEYLEEIGEIFSRYKTRKTHCRFDYEAYIDDLINHHLSQGYLYQKQADYLTEKLKEKLRFFESYWYGEANTVGGKVTIIEYINGFFQGIEFVCVSDHEEFFFNERK